MKRSTRHTVEKGSVQRLLFVIFVITNGILNEVLRSCTAETVKVFLVFENVTQTYLHTNLTYLLKVQITQDPGSTGLENQSKITNN